MTRTILAIDTSTAAVVAGVVRRSDAGAIEVLAQRISHERNAHAELLTPNVLTAVADAGLTLAVVDAVVVGCGPGPFTGLRVGMATAATFGHALGIPVHGVCSLDAIGVRTEGEVIVLTDARRREVYWARYRDGVRVDGPGVAAPDDVPVAGAQWVAGSPPQGEWFGLTRTGDEVPSPAGLVSAVAEWDAEPDPLVPLYLRRPDAKTLAERGADATGRVRR